MFSFDLHSEYLKQNSVEPALTEKLSKHRQTRETLREILLSLQNENTVRYVNC